MSQQQHKPSKYSPADVAIEVDMMRDSLKHFAVESKRAARKVTESHQRLRLCLVRAAEGDDAAAIQCIDAAIVAGTVAAGLAGGGEGGA